MARLLRILSIGLLCAGLITAVAKRPGFAADGSAQGRYLLLRLDGTIVKFGAPKLGRAAVITYALIDRPTAFPRARNCRAMVPLTELTGYSPKRAKPGSYRRGPKRSKQIPALNQAAIAGELSAAFAMWARIAGVRFSRVRQPEHADIVIGAQRHPRGRAFANVAARHDRLGSKPVRAAKAINRSRGKRRAGRRYNLRSSPEYRHAPVRTITRSLICINSAKPWKIGFDGNVKSYDLRYTFTHEIGHAIGLDHVSNPNMLMNFRYHERFQKPQSGDISGAVKLYGPPLPPRRDVLSHSQQNALPALVSIP